MSEPNTVVGKILLIFVFSAQKYKIVSWSMVVAFVVCARRNRNLAKKQTAIGKSNSKRVCGGGRKSQIPAEDP